MRDGADLDDSQAQRVGVKKKSEALRGSNASTETSTLIKRAINDANSHSLKK